MTTVLQTNSPGNDHHLAVLDGWRGLCIIMVLAAHLLPLGPSTWELNFAAGCFGMAIFFGLSGFLITHFLLRHCHVGDFLIRRFARILPLSWLALLVTLPLVSAPPDWYLPNFLFYANLPPQHLTDTASHFWSLGVEMQFYLGIATLVGAFGRRGLLALPAICLAVTASRIYSSAYVDIVTWRRADEILSGATLALMVSGKFGPVPAHALRRLNAWWLLPVFAASCHPSSGPLNYLRPYLAAGLIGVTVVAPTPVQLKLLKQRTLVYLATISFALYVIHHLLISTGLGHDVSKTMKYLKRAPLLAITFALAHISTFYLEHPCIAWGKRLSARLGWSRAASSGE